MANANALYRRPTERQRITYDMAAAIHLQECRETPGEEYPTWAQLEEWAKWIYIKRAEKALNTITRKYQLRQRG